jgi:ribosomal protein S18 acetylase RimI-like enzyme
MIRKATSDDIPAVSELNQTVQMLHVSHAPHLFKAPADGALAFRSWFEKVLIDPDSTVLVAERDGAAVGYVYAQEIRREETWIRPAQRFILLHHIAVATLFQNAGIGTALVIALFQVANTNGVSRLELDVWAFNTPAKSFFSKFGFSVFNHRMEVSVDGPNQSASTSSPTLPTPAAPEQKP